MTDLNSEKTPFDAIHMVVYGVENTPTGPIPNKRFLSEGYYQTQAVTLLLKEGLSRNVVIGGINYGSENGSTRISNVYVEALSRELNEQSVGDINIIAEAEILSPDQLNFGAKETGKEVDFVLDQAQAREWRRLLCISYDLHEPRVRKLYIKKCSNIRN